MRIGEPGSWRGKCKSGYTRPAEAPGIFIEKAELALKVANLEKQQLENEIKAQQQTMQLRNAAI